MGTDVGAGRRPVHDALGHEPVAVGEPVMPRRRMAGRDADHTGARLPVAPHGPHDIERLREWRGRLQQDERLEGAVRRRAASRTSRATSTEVASSPARCAGRSSTSAPHPAATRAISASSVLQTTRCGPSVESRGGEAPETGGPSHERDPADELHVLVRDAPTPATGGDEEQDPVTHRHDVRSRARPSRHDATVGARSAMLAGA